MTLTNCTLSGNATTESGAEGGGLYIGYSGHVLVANSIVAGNTAANSADPDVSGQVFSNGLNIFGSAVDGSTPGDRQNVPVGVLFAGGLADNGGPSQTIALLDNPANPALGRADPAYAPPTDQRDVPRPQPNDTHPDIGAFELNQSNPTPQPAAATFVVASAGDVTADDGVLTLREALALADADSSTADRIEFAPQVQGRTIILAGSQLTANTDVTIDGGAGVSIDADHASRVLLVQGLGTDVHLQHVTITGGQTTGDYEGGGGVRVEAHATLTLEHSTVTGNRTAGQYANGGGISGIDSSLTLIDSEISANLTTSDYAYGGGIFGDSVTVIRSTVSGNRVAAEYGIGGGIAGFAVTLANSTVSGNDGGGIHGSVVTLASSTISGNRGDVGVYGHHVSLADSTVSGNAIGIFAVGYPAGHYTIFGSLHVDSSTISGNATVEEGRGGGVSLFGVHAYITNTIVAGNRAVGGAPDIYGTITDSNGHNIFGSAVEGAVAGDLQNVSANLLFAGGLADHGGPTQTIALRDVPDNPALRGADPADASATDQRGEARPQPAGSPGHRRLRVERDGWLAERDRRHGARRIAEWHRRCRPDPGAAGRRLSVGLRW